MLGKVQPRLSSSWSTRKPTAASTSFNNNKVAMAASATVTPTPASWFQNWCVPPASETATPFF